MIAVAAWQHVAVGFGVLCIAPFIYTAWIRREGVGLPLVMVGGGFAQIILGLIKPNLPLSDMQRVVVAAVALVSAIAVGWRLVRQSRRAGRNI